MAAKKKRKAKRKPPNPDGKGSTTTHPELQKRLDFVEQLLVEYLSYTQVVAATASEFDVTDRTAEKYIAKVYLRWDGEREKVRPHHREKQIRRLTAAANRLAAKNDLDARDLGALVKVETLLARILGTLAPERHEVYHYDPDKCTDEQLERIAEGEDPRVVLGESASVH